MATPTTKPRVRFLAFRRWLSALAGLLIGLVGLAGTIVAHDAPPQKPIDFAHDVALLIKQHCAKCHTDGTYKGSFSLDTRETMLKSKAVAPGKSGQSELIERITSADPEFRMPPKGPRLAAGEVARLTAWIDQGDSLGGRVHVQAAWLHGPAQASSPQAARRA